MVSHLRRYEEADESNKHLNSSFISSKNPSEPPRSELDVIESDPPNIRILVNSYQGGAVDGVDTLASNQSSRASTGRSIPTNSSNGSGNKTIIAPDKVSHLIQGNVGGMTFDHTKRCWVKRKTSKSSISSDTDKLQSDLTEDDPFKEIPDLDVDESQELRHVQGTSTGSRPTSSGQEMGSPSQPLQAGLSVLAGSAPRKEEVLRDSESSVISKQSHFTSSGPKFDTRATSWGDELKFLKNMPVSVQQQASRAEEAEAELKILKGQPASSPPRSGPRKHQARVVTVAFSSPLANVINDPNVDEDNLFNELSSLNLNSSALNPPSNRKQNTKRSQRSTDIKTRHRENCRASVRARFNSSRIVSRIEEGDEQAPLERVEIEASGAALTVTTPQQARNELGRLTAPPVNERSPYAGFHLTPLSDFTINQVDQSLNLDVTYLAKRRGLLSIQEVEGTYSLAIKDLVEKITNVEPYEPYWEHIRKLQLPGKRLLTLHMLDDFCQRIEDLDVSDNELGQLNGAPSTLRKLNIRGNCLSNLTAWGHLRNLQYIDVSGNKLTSLGGFKDLLHLRELKAEDNQIESLDGILGHSGLIKLKVGRNVIKTIDLQQAAL